MRYAFRRHLGIGAKEYEAMSWWEHDLLLEGLVKEAESNKPEVVSDYGR